eukprot:TRINITY_DN783_c0_g1_i1.p1 TRINITY_DN783_c0_g1~~TRINITY_DN783_c0_g1_i1.p1  ORF type:complete len:254 (+),score=39.59 TRINITY_DN783_c0_g1_i1:65-763(+)
MEGARLPSPETRPRTPSPPPPRRSPSPARKRRSPSPVGSRSPKRRRVSPDYERRSDRRHSPVERRSDSYRGSDIYRDSYRGSDRGADRYRGDRVADRYRGDERDHYRGNDRYRGGERDHYPRDDRDHYPRDDRDHYPRDDRRNRERSRSRDGRGGNEKSIYIGNLPYDIRREEVRILCENFGEVYNVTLGARGFGFVSMESRAAREAARELDGRTFGGRTLHVNEAYHEARR